MAPPSLPRRALSWGRLPACHKNNEIREIRQARRLPHGSRLLLYLQAGFGELLGAEHALQIAKQRGLSRLELALGGGELRFLLVGQLHGSRDVSLGEFFLLAACLGVFFGLLAGLLLFGR